jgi:succinyl-diaminopimelate desuccinylase
VSSVPVPSAPYRGARHDGERDLEQRGVQERLTSITADLVGFATVERDSKALARCVWWVEQHARERAPRLRVRRFTSGRKPSVLLWHGDALPRVLFCGHLDVVEAADPAAFTLRRDLDGADARLVGRGTADMKGPVAALLDILETIPLPGLGLLLTTDEEIGGTHGTRHVLDWLADQGALPKVALLPDGGAGMRLVVEQKGVLHLRLLAEGRAAHASRPWLGINALERLFEGYAELRRQYPTPAAEDDWRVTVTLTELRNVGNSPNTVPQRVEGVLDVRFPGGRSTSSGSANTSTTGDGRAYARRIARWLRPYQTTSKTLLYAPAFCLDPGSSWVGRLQSVARDQLGSPLPLCREAGASDARFFAARGVPVLVFQPRCADWHGANEWIDLGSLALFRGVCADFARSALA